jgi:DNA-binding response OmpR family regulator
MRGAYLTKPFGMYELLARMRVALRHQLEVHGEQPVFRTGDLSVDLVRHIVRVTDKDVKQLAGSGRHAPLVSAVHAARESM